MRRFAAAAVLAPLAATALLATGCAWLGHAGDRDGVVRRILASTVQLRTEREGGTRRAGSGVVLASDATGSWIVTTRHLLDPPVTQTITLVLGGRRKPVRADVAALAPDTDLAVLRVDGVRLPPVELKDEAHLGDAVWVVAFPWGRRLTMVSGVVSQIASSDGDTAIAGAPAMVDASVSYGASGGGVFDAASGALIGVVESHRTARVSLPETRNRTFEVPVPGETSVIASAAIRGFVANSPLAHVIQR